MNNVSAMRTLKGILERVSTAPEEERANAKMLDSEPGTIACKVWGRQSEGGAACTAHAAACAARAPPVQRPCSP
eukprot:133301-Chlamydomonas_euryale.AAC.2